jgi:hypothetical protein
LHTLLQLPQLLSSEATLVQTLPQRVGADEEQPVVHCPAPVAVEQTGTSSPQRLAQRPQLSRVLSWVSQSGLEALQFPKPSAQTGVVHLPPTQLEVEFAKAQASPQALQLIPVPSGVSQPSLATRLQSAKPGLQRPSWHAPAAQVASALANWHFCVHEPQRSRSVLRSTQAVPHLSGADAGQSEAHA